MPVVPRTAGVISFTAIFLNIAYLSLAVIVLNFVKNAHKLQTNTKTVRLHSVDASVFVTLRRDKSVDASVFVTLHRDKVCLRRPNEDGA